MRVVSLVPSLTETLLEAGADVVGRTRYCVHPTARVRGIPVVGGTKDLREDRLRDLRPDLLVLDQEENLPWMKEQSPCAVHVFHATNVATMSTQMQALAARFTGIVRDRLLEQAARWERVHDAPAAVWRWDSLPTESRREGPAGPWTRLIYLIWRDPWMSVSRNTFIASVFGKLGADECWPEFIVKYPTVDPNQYSPSETMLILSSEPYPFEKKWAEVARELPHGRVLVDGEVFSWFGVRSLEFLERELGISTGA